MPSIHYWLYTYESDSDSVRLAGVWTLWPVTYLLCSHLNVLQPSKAQSPASSIKLHAYYGGKDSSQGLGQKDFKVFGNLPQRDSLVGSNPTGPRRKNKRRNSKGGYRHFKAANWLYSFRPLWHGVSLTPNVKPITFWSPFPLPSEEHMSPISALLSGHTIKARMSTSVTKPVSLSRGSWDGHDKTSHFILLKGQ